MYICISMYIIHTLMYLSIYNVYVLSTYDDMNVLLYRDISLSDLLFQYTKKIKPTKTFVSHHSEVVFLDASRPSHPPNLLTILTSLTVTLQPREKGGQPSTPSDAL